MAESEVLDMMLKIQGLYTHENEIYIQFYGYPYSPRIINIKNLKKFIKDFNDFSMGKEKFNYCRIINYETNNDEYKKGAKISLSVDSGEKSCYYVSPSIFFDVRIWSSDKIYSHTNEIYNSFAAALAEFIHILGLESKNTFETITINKFILWYIEPKYKLIEKLQLPIWRKTSKGEPMK